MNTKFKKGKTSITRVSLSWKKEIEDYQKNAYYLYQKILSQRDILDKCCDLAGLKESNKRMKLELKRLGKL